MILEIIKYKLKGALLPFVWIGIIVFDNNYVFLRHGDKEIALILIIPACIAYILRSKNEIFSIFPVSKKEVLKANVIIGTTIFSMVFLVFNFAYPAIRTGEKLNLQVAIICMIGYACILMFGEILGNIKYILNILGYISIWVVYALKTVVILKIIMGIYLIWIVFFIAIIYRKVLKKLAMEGVCMG